MLRLAGAASVVLLGAVLGVFLGIGLGVVFTSVAQAEPGDGAAPLEVAIGETVARDVGFAIGLQCDDFTMIRADLRTAASGTNVFEVTGVRLGDTACRAGTTPSRTSYLFRIHVIPARRR